MKKEISLLLAAAMLLLAGCSTKDTSAVSMAAETERAQVEESELQVEDGLDVSGTENEETISVAERTEEEQTETAYRTAKELLQKGEYEDALSMFRELGDYQDCKKLRKSAAFSAVCSYVKEYGAAYTPLEDLNSPEFPYALIREPEENVFEYLAVDENGGVVFGTGRGGTSDQYDILIRWTVWLCLSEDSDIAVQNYHGTTAISYNGRSMEQEDNGSTELNIAEYTEASNLDMTFERWGRNYLYEETTEEKMLSDSYGEEAIAQINAIPISVAENLLAETGVTLGDLGFTALDDSSVPAEAGDGSGKVSGTGTTDGEIHLTITDGTSELNYAGWEYMPDGIMTDEKYADANILVVLMDYTNNLEDEPKEMQNDFWFRAYQNGVELDSSFGSYRSDSYEPLENRFKQVMMGGTVRIGYYFLLEDDSPVTIIANEQGNSDNKQSMVINLE